MILGASQRAHDSTVLAPVHAGGGSRHPPDYAVESICAWGYGVRVWDVEFTDQFEAWWDTLSTEEQQSIDAAVGLLEQRGPGLG